MATLTISLPDGLKQWAETQARNERFQDAGDYVGDLIRQDHERRQWVDHVQSLIDEGINSGISTRSMDEVLAEARLRAGVDPRDL